MPITVIVGGQFGSEGKGKTTAYLCREHGFDVAVRCGGPNSGHTVTIDDESVVLRQIPAGVVNPHTKLYIAAGCLLDLDILLDEISSFNLTPNRLGIDYNAAIISKQYSKEEKENGLGARIGSTCSGTGIAVAKRALRDVDMMQAKDVTELKPFLCNVSDRIMNHYLKDKKIVIEGTQGFGLSVYHSPYYPYTTSRDTIASAFLSEVGISPLVVSDIIMVIRTFPIRVGGNSGNLPNEIDWETVQRESGYHHKIQEFTSATKRLRRVARFDMEIIRMAVSVNRPTKIALMGVDYLDYKNKGIRHYDELTEKTKSFIQSFENKLGVNVNLIGTGPKDQELIER